ncbi:MAG: glutamate--tRNA ligase [Chloroflexota bacterium]
MTVRTRFAPSPTGYLHIGGARTALFSWLYAKKHGGQFVLRIEDTDEKRTVDGAMDALMASMRWLGIDWDEGPDVGGPYGPYVQSQRREIYHKWAHWLVDNGFAYKCFATAEELKEMREAQIAAGKQPEYDRRYRDIPQVEVERLEREGRPYVIRHKMPLDGTTTVPDVVRGDIVFENSQLTDYVIFKSSGLPTYHHAVVVDDHLMEISHITRGDEWVNTAPVHVQLYKAFGWKMPQIAHLPVILNPSGKGKLSKRTQSFQDDNQLVLVKTDEFEQYGYLPPALVNFLTNIGWSYGDDVEIFTPEESMARFELENINPAPAKMPYSKLDWMNNQYVMALSPEALVEQLIPIVEREGIEVSQEALLSLAPVVNMRLKRLTDIVDQLQFLVTNNVPNLAPEQLTHKKMGRESAQNAFSVAYDFISNLPADEFTVDNLGTKLREIGEAYTDNSKAGPFLGTARLAVTGQKVSPPLFEAMLALGQQEVISRLGTVLEKLKDPE